MKKLLALALLCAVSYVSAEDAETAEVAAEVSTEEVAAADENGVGGKKPKTQEEKSDCSSSCSK